MAMLSLKLFKMKKQKPNRTPSKPQEPKAKLGSHLRFLFFSHIPLSINGETSFSPPQSMFAEKMHGCKCIMGSKLSYQPIPQNQAKS
jgi:hypothetical protein